MIIKRLAHVCIAAKDLPAAERFYCSCLGFRKVFHFVKADRIVGFYLAVAEGTYIEVFLSNEIDAGAKLSIKHICFEVADLDQVTERLRSQGYAVTEKKLGADRSWQAWTSDPSGVRIEFHQYTSDSSQVTGADCRLGQV